MSIPSHAQTVLPTDTFIDDQSDDSFDPNIEDEQTAFSEPPRPRFNGSPRTYLRNNQEEHAIAESLDRIESNDLSIHLYNVHHLKRRLCSKSDEGRNVKPYFRKERSYSTDQKDEWKPSRTWTAWPLKPDTVPRVGKHYQHALEDDVKGHRDPALQGPRKKPSSVLEDCLLSEILKQARYNFRSEVNEDVGALDDSKTQSKRDTVRPVIMDDEGEARRLTQPVVRHLVTKLEGLLSALHHSRQSIHQGGTSDSDSDQPSGAESSRSTSRSRSRPRKRSRSRKGTANRTQMPRQSNPRDWSEVLSIAALTGWDGDTVRRTSTRCAALFDESMDLIALNADNDRPSAPTATPTFEPEAIAEDAASLSPATDASTGDLRCPYKTCERHDKPYSVRWRLNEHMRRTHRDESTSYQGSYKGPPTPPRMPVEDEMVDGVHVDGFLQPIMLARRPRKARSPKSRSGSRRLGSSGRPGAPGVIDEGIDHIPSVNAGDDHPLKSLTSNTSRNAQLTAVTSTNRGGTESSTDDQTPASSDSTMDDSSDADITAPGASSNQ